MESIFNGLIEFDNREDLENFIDEMDAKDSLQITEKGLEYCCKKGIFDMGEIYILYSCLKKIKSKLYENKINIPNDSHRDTSDNNRN